MVELGHFACILAFCLAASQLTTAWLGKDSLRLQQQLLLREFMCMMIACGSLWWAFLQHDFSVAVVHAHSHHHLPWWYRITALWGGHEGSMLLWLTLLSGWRMAFGFWANFKDEDKRAISVVLSLIAIGLMAFLLFSSNPFARLLPNAPFEGNDLNPLLQDPGMASHPPLLYFGYVAFAIPYACICVMLWEGRVIEDWAARLRPWVLLAWSALTAGIVLGSWWAYRELGWGGWWFWDPVENASLLPWFGGILMIHGLALVQKQQVGQAWTALVAVFGFILSLLGTFLVRSGLLISVHAFASDPHRGIWILSLIGVYGGSALLLYALKAKALFTKQSTPLLSKGSAILANQIFLSVMLATVLLGTLYPMALEVLGLGKISVGAPYFNQVMPLLCMPLLLLLALLPCLVWQGSSWVIEKNALLRASGLASVALLIAWGLLDWQNAHVIAYLVLACAVAAGIMTIAQGIGIAKRGRLTLTSMGMLIAHLGFIAAMIAMSVTSALSESRMVALYKDTPYVLAGHTFVYTGSEAIKSSNYHGVRASIAIQKGQKSWLANPELRVFEPSQMSLAHTAIIVRPGYDIYMALGEPIKAKEKGEGWTIRVQVKPMVRGIWLSGLMIALGGILAFFARRKRYAKAI